MHLVSPAILVKSEEEFVEKISHPAMRVHAELWQLDILDGSMFNQTSWSDAETAATYLPLPDLELHLMVQDPMTHIMKWKNRIPSVRRAIIHAEIDQDIEKLLFWIKEEGLEAGVAINPETSIDAIRNILPLVDVVLVMGVNPGKSGQAFLGDPILKKIRTLRKEHPNLQISVDGGVNRQNALSLIEAGATQLCASSAIWKADDPKHAFTALSALL